MSVYFSEQTKNIYKTECTFIITSCYAYLSFPSSFSAAKAAQEMQMSVRQSVSLSAHLLKLINQLNEQQQPLPMQPQPNQQPPLQPLQPP